MAGLGIDSLLKENNQKVRWYPGSVFDYCNSIKIGSPKEKRNFAYSLQYIEYLEKQIAEMNLSAVLCVMTFKSYIITSMGVVEMIFQNLLKNSGNWNTSEWREMHTFEGNGKIIEGKNIKIKNVILEKVEKYDMRMDLDSMIKKVSSKGLITIGSNNFPALKKLRELRNKVHLQINNEDEDHDYNSFGFQEIQMMRRILFLVLTSPEVSELGEDIFNYINEAYLIGIKKIDNTPY